MRASPLSPGRGACDDDAMHTVLIVDDDGHFRDRLRGLLEAEGIEVLGTAATGRAAIDATLAAGPEIVIVDIGLPDLDGFAVARELAAHGSAARVLLTSSRGRDAYGRRLSETGIPFVAKDELGADAIEQAR